MSLSSSTAKLFVTSGSCQHPYGHVTGEMTCSQESHASAVKMSECAKAWIWEAALVSVFQFSMHVAWAPQLLLDRATHVCESVFACALAVSCGSVVC